MKILYIATPNSPGHHLSYFQGVSDVLEEYALVTEKFCPELNCKQYYNNTLNFGTKSFYEYLRMIRFIRGAVKDYQPDLVHIQCGDNFYRFLGIGLSNLGCKKIVMTFHHVNRSKIKDLSIKRIFKKISVGVVHTHSIKKMLISMGIKNVEHIEYPQFNKVEKVESQIAKIFFGLHPDTVCLAAIGSTRNDKGLDVLLTALDNVEFPFQLLIAGSEGDIKRQLIDELTKKYKEKIKQYIKYLNDEELCMALNAADIIVLPYKKFFDGASGPLCEGVSLKKMIIGPDHGSIGDIISKNHLGYVFQSENIESLSRVIEEALTTEWSVDEVYEKYMIELDPKVFANKYKNLFELIFTEN